MTKNSDKRLTFLLLCQSAPGPIAGWRHPASISVHPRGRRTLINVSMGTSFVNVGGQIPVERVIVDGEFNESFAEEFDATEGRWLVPYLVRLAAGERVTTDDLIEAYHSRFGQPPKVVTGTDTTF